MAIQGLIVFIILLLVLVPTSVFGIAELENKTIISNSENLDIILTLEFGKNQYSKSGKSLLADYPKAEIQIINKENFLDITL